LPLDAAGSDYQHHRKKHHQSQTTQSNIPNDRFEQRQVASEEVTGEADNCGPGEASQRAEQLEAPEGHACHAGKHRSPGAQAQHEARREDRLVAMAREEELRTRDVLGPDAEDAPEPLDEWPAALETEEVADVSARGRAEKAEQDDQDDRVVASRRPCGRRKQEDLAGKGNAGALDEDAQPRRGITERIDDRGWIQFNRSLPRSPGQSVSPILIAACAQGGAQRRMGRWSLQELAHKPSIYWTTR